ncbi:MAG TPA: hypothetical protein VMT60_02390, partial [Candidatus Bathyarchaeia archaeon]|nr:hypothetical protein [Candidatus Bathyarchaeia archaeon]
MDTNSPVFGGARGRRSRIVLAWTAAALALICDAGCGRSGGAVIGEQPVKQVISVENDVDALRAWSAKGAKASVLIRIDPSDGMTVFPANLMDDMNAAAGYLRRRNTDVLQKIAPLIEHGGTVSLGYMAGMYKRVVWVTPSVRSVGETPVEVLKNFLVTRRGYPAAALADFKVDGKWISGSITGVPVTITSLADLSLREGENAVVDINLSYFTAMKLADPSYRMGTKSLLGFLRELGAKNVRADLVTVNLSTQDNLVPMDLRYYGAVVRDALEKPGFLTGAMPAKWRSMIQADDSLGAKRYESAAAIYRDLTGTVKDDPGLYFSLAIAEGFSNKGAECRAALLEAYRLDPEYLKGFFQLARVLADAGKIDAGLEILDTPDLSKIIAE